MSFVERHISLMVLAIAAMIALRVTGLVNFETWDTTIRDRGFLQVPLGLFESEKKSASLATMIASTLQKQRSTKALMDPTDAEIVTGSTASAEGEKSNPPSGTKTEKSDVKDQKNTGVEKVQAPLPPVMPQVDSAERSLLEKLALRRTELDQREQDLANREALLQAAEKRLDDRTAELKIMETELQAKSEAMNAERQTLKPVIIMYETMKPKDAARLFEKLDVSVLLPLAKGMNPRKLADVLALTDPVLAGKVTKSLSSLQSPSSETKAKATNPANELPDFSNKGSE